MFFPLKQHKVQHFCRQKQQFHLSFILSTLLQKLCQKPSLMSKVMTIHHLQRRGGLIRVDIMSERSPPLWQNYRPTPWQWVIFSICLVIISVWEFLRFSILARLFVLHLRDGHVTLAGVNFTLTPEVISQATEIPNVGEVWPKGRLLDFVHFEPYVRPSSVEFLTGVFPSRFLRSEYAPIMRLIMRYFTCEGRFTQVYSYHIRLLMHFTRVRMMNIPIFLFQNIRRMVPKLQKKTPAQQDRSLYHYGLIQLIVSYQLTQQGISWEEFISREFFTVPHQPHQEVIHEVGGPSQQPDAPVTRHVSSTPLVTYQRGLICSSQASTISTAGGRGLAFIVITTSVISTSGGRGLAFFTSTGTREGKAAHDWGEIVRRSGYWSWRRFS